MGFRTCVYVMAYEYGGWGVGVGEGDDITIYYSAEKCTASTLLKNYSKNDVYYNNNITAMSCHTLFASPYIGDSPL